MKRSGFILLLLALPGVLVVWGQTTHQSPAFPTITFDRVWEDYTPQNINITVQATGPAKYISRNPFKPPEQAGPDPDYLLEFTLSSRNQEKLFRYAREAN